MTKTTGFFSLFLGLTLCACSSSSDDVTAAQSNGLLQGQFDRMELRSTGAMPWGQDLPNPECGADYTDSITVDTASQLLHWDLCRTEDRKVSKGQRVLTEAEFSSIKAELGKIEVSSNANCGSDKPIVTLDMTYGQTTQHYHDDFYSSCSWAASGSKYVKNLDGLDNALRLLAK
jgi:hypothetical protein